MYIVYESREQGKVIRPKQTVLEREILELSWSGLELATTRFLGRCSTN